MEKKELQKKVLKPYSCKPRGSRSVYSDIGDPILPRNRYFVKDGKKMSEPDTPIDLEAYLLSSQAQTDLAVIAARAAAGDVSVINVKPGGLEGDLVGMPNSVNDVNNLKKSMNKTFNALDPEIKKLFKDPNEFYEACLNNKLGEILKNSKKVSEVDKSDVKPEVQPDAKPEVKE